MEKPRTTAFLISFGLILLALISLSEYYSIIFSVRIGKEVSLHFSLRTCDSDEKQNTEAVEEIRGSPFCQCNTVSLNHFIVSPAFTCFLFMDMLQKEYKEIQPQGNKHNVRP